MLWISNCLSTAGLLTGRLRLVLAVGVCGQIFFENRFHWSTPTRIYTRIVVVVNARHFLWITLFCYAKSWTCLLYKPVNDSVLSCCLFWTIFDAVYKHDFVHNPYLWICRTLSTGHLFCWQNPSCRNLVAGMAQVSTTVTFFGFAGTTLPGLFCANSVNRFTVKRIYTRIVVVVNTGYFLWTSLFLSM
jgi:hypothetical protein